MPLVVSDLGSTQGMAAIVERRPTSQRERALAELELLLEGPAKDHDATLEHLRGITRA